MTEDKRVGRRRQMVMEMPTTFADMLRMLDPELRERLELPWWLLFPPVYERKDQASLTATEQGRFLCALDTLINNGTYGQLVAIHAQVHYQHGTQRFLPWHRVYLLIFEQALRSIHPDVSIPYWDWTQASEQSIPGWLASVTPTVPMPPPQPPMTVVRFPGSSADPGHDRIQRASRRDGQHLRRLHLRPGSHPRSRARLGRREHGRYPDRPVRPDLLDAPRQHRPPVVALAANPPTAESKPDRNRARQQRHGPVVLHRGRHPRHHGDGLHLRLALCRGQCHDPL